MKRMLLVALCAFFLKSSIALAQPPLAQPIPLEPVLVDPPSFVPIATRAPSGPYRIWGSSEFLLWWTKNVPVNTPLVTQALNTADPTAGAIGSANTAVLLGNQDFNLSRRYGGRFILGGWLDSDSRIGLEGTYFFINPRTVTQGVASDGSTTIGLPYYDVIANSEAFAPTTGSLATGIPGLNGTGSAFLQVSNRLQGGELNLIGRLRDNPDFTLDILGGFRYVHFGEDVDFAATTSLPGTPTVIIRRRIPLVIPGTPPFTGSIYDSFHASNNFYGGQLGLRARRDFGRLYLQPTLKVALGCMHESVTVAGTTVASSPGGAAAANFTTNQGGFYAQPTNIGTHSRNVFAVVPEVDLKLGYQLTRRVSVFVAYDFLYLSAVARPGNSIDHAVNPSQVPLFAGVPNTLTGPAAPNFNFNSTGFWAQGVNFGVEIKF